MSRTNRSLSGLLLTLLLLASCAQGTATPTPTGPAATTTSPNAAPTSAGAVTVISFGAQEYLRAAYEPLITKFNQENPDVQVQFVSLDELFRVSGSQSFDPTQIMRKIVSMADTAAGWYVSDAAVTNGYLYDLKPLIDADSSFDQSDFHPGVLDGVTRDGKIHQLPHTINIELLSYNKDMFAARGIATPKTDWSWNDMLAVAEQLAQKRGTKVETYGLADYSTTFFLLLSELSTRGIDLFNAKAETQRLDTPEIIAALEKVAALVDAGAVFYQAPGSDGSIASGDVSTLIRDQQVGMWSYGMLNGPDASAPAFKVGTLPFPRPPVPFFSNAQSYLMSSGTQYPQQSWRWLAFLSRQTVEAPFMAPNAVGAVPARKSVAEQSGYWGKLDSETADAVRAMLARRGVGQQFGSNPDERIFQPLSKLIEDSLSGKKAPAQAAREAQTALEALVLNNQATPTVPPDTSPIIVATPLPAVSAEGKTQITFATIGLDPTAVRRAADSFNREDNGAFVTILPDAFQQGPQSLAQLAAQADCFTWYSVPQTSELTATLDLQPLIDADAAFNLADYPTSLVDVFRNNNALYGLPYLFDFRVVGYNQTAFEAAGLTPPRADWTIAEFIDTAQKLTSGNGENKQYGFVSSGNITDDLRFLLERFGAPLTTGSGDAIKPNYTDPKIVQTARLLLDMLKANSPHTKLDGYEANSSYDGTSYQLLSDGRAAMWLGYGLYSIGHSGDFVSAVAPAPLGTTPLTRNDLNITGMHISAQSKHPDTCWQWLKYLSSNAVANTGRLPARLSALDTPEFAEQSVPGAAAMVKAVAKALEARPLNSNEFSNDTRLMLDSYWLFRALDHALQGKDLERELATAQEFAEKDLECQRGGSDAQSCATTVDPTYKGYRTMQPGDPQVVPVN